MRKKDEQTQPMPHKEEPVESALRRSAAKVNPDPAFVERLSSQLKEARAKKRRAVSNQRGQGSRFMRWLVWGGLGLGAAVAMMLIVMAGILILRTPSVPASPAAVESPTPGDGGPGEGTVATPTPRSKPPATPVPVETQPPFAADLPPAVVRTVPGDGAEVNLSAGILIRFTKPMDRASVEQALSVNPPVTGTFTWENDTTVSFGAKALASGVRYQVMLDTSARSADGLPLSQGRTFAFTTVGPLTVTHTSPVEGARALRGDTPLVLAFNYPLVPINCTGQAAEAGGDCPPLPLEITPPVAGEGMWVNTSVYRFDPDPAWMAGATYEVTLPAGVRSVDGAELAQPITRSFSTAAPAVQTMEPANATRNVPLESTIRITFNTPMDADATEDAFQLSDPDGDGIPGAITWENHGATLVFSPTGNLAPETTYTVLMDAQARAVSGAPLEEGEQTTFTTVPPIGVRRIVGTSRSSTSRIEIYESVQIELEGLLDPTTLNDNVQVTLGDQEIEANINWSTYNEANEAYVWWEKEAGARYCVTVLPDLADRYGNTLGERRTQCFTVGDMPAIFTPVINARAATLDAAEIARIYFTSVNVQAATLTLTELQESDFLNRDAEYNQTATRSWEVPVAGASNETVLVPVDLNEGQPLATGYYGLGWRLPNTQRDAYSNLRVAVVDRHVLVKMGADEALIWVTDLRSGEPVVGAMARLLSPDRRELGRAPTGNDGVARFAIPEQISDRWSQYTAIVGEPGAPGFGVAYTTWNEDVSPWDFNIPYDLSPIPAYSSYLQTDRPIYRPGQEIHVRGIVRLDDDGAYQVPEPGKTVKIELRTPRGEAIETAEPALSEMGTWATTFRLPAEAQLGTYLIAMEVPGSEGSFNSLQVAVAAYRKPEFEVLVTPEREDILNGEPFRALVEATYYAGGTVSNAEVQWTLRARPAAFAPSMPGWWRWATTTQWWAPWRDSEIIASGRGTTDQEGRLLIDVQEALEPLGDDETAGTQRWELEVTVTDEANFPVTQRGEGTVHPSRFYLGLKPESWIARAGEPAAVELLALDWAALPVTDQEVEITLARRSWIYTPATEPFRSGTWTYEDTVVETLSVRTDEDGAATFEVTPPRSGPYVVVAESTDASGNLVRSETQLWVSGSGAAAWQMAENKIEPIADAERYQPGDVARVLLPTPFEAPYEVLMTIERGSILEVRQFTAREANPLIEIPIAEDYVPNVVVSFVAVKDAESLDETPDIRIGMLQLEVEPVNQVVAVAVTPDCAAAGNTGAGATTCTYQPGDTVTLAVSTTGADGEPVDAEVALSVVDKAVLALADDRAPTLLDTFYAPRRLRVVTGDGLIALHNRLFDDLEALHQRAQQLARERAIGGIGGGGGGEPLFAPDVRQEFPDTALWEAQLRTGPTGERIVTFEVPDSLTTWVADARAVTGETEVGQTTTEFRVTQPLLVRPVTPRFFVAGDEAEVAAVVHNNTGEDVETSVRLETNLTTGDALQQRVTVPPEGRVRVAWRVTVPETGMDAARLTFYAEGAGYSDAARPNVGREGDRALPVYRYETPDVVSTSGALTGADTRVEALIVPPEAGPASSLTLRLAPTLAAGMIPGLDYLDNFPHACTEQLVSRFLPNAVTYRTLEMLGVKDLDLEKALRERIGEVQEELLSRQNPDGGWGWWDGGESEFQVSAYAALGLVQAKAAGFEIDERRLNEALGFLERRLDLALLNDVTALPQALTLYVLAEAGRAAPPEAAAELYEARETLDVTGRAYLALALGLTDPDDPRVTTLLESLRADVSVTASGAHWESIVREYWITSTRATAIALDAFARLAPDDPLVPQATHWLMAARTKDRWKTTQETAWAVLALTDVMVATGELNADYDWGVALNTEIVDEGTVTAATAQASLDYVIPADDLLRNWPNALEISRGEGDGVLYYTADLALLQPVENLAAESRGVTVRRTYCKADLPLDAETAFPWQNPSDDLAPCTPVTSAKPGDLIEVRLTLTLPRTRYYFMVEDVYPAGMEPVDPSLNTEQEGTTPSLTGKRSGWWWPRFDHQELRDERAVFYANRLTAGTYEVRYYLRAAVPGTYQAIPATASEMYFPEVWGRSDGAVFTVMGSE